MSGLTYKYQQIAATLRQEIGRQVYEPGDRLPSEHELASRFRVNHLTMRQALDVLAREGRVVKRWRSGTFVNDPPGPSPADLRQIVYVGPLQEHGYQALYLCLTREAQDLRAMVTGFDPSREANRAVVADRLGSILRQCSQVVCTNHWLDLVLELAEPAQRITVADIHLGAVPRRPGSPIQAISVDWQAATSLATQHLLEQGYRRIALLDTIDNAPPEVLVGQPHPTRMSVMGYAHALHAAGIDEQIVVGHRFDHPRGMAAALDWMLAKYGSWPNAFVCEGDFRAGPLIQELAHRGFRVPDDIGIVGVGDTPWCQLIAPHLSSVNLGEDEIARLALVLGDQRPAPDGSLIRVTPRVVARLSTCPNPTPITEVSV